MTTYVVFVRQDTKDQTEMDNYASLASKARDGHQITPLAFYGELEVLEGPSAEGAVILSFTDKEAAKRWYYSPEYQAAKAHRNLGANYSVLMIDGLD